MCKEKGYYCPTPGCGNMAFEPGHCSACGALLEEEEMTGTEDTIEGLTSLAGVQPRPEHIEEIRSKAAGILKEMDEEETKYGPGLRCPKCGGMLRHERLNGYRCIRGCQ